MELNYNVKALLDARYKLGKVMNEIGAMKELAKLGVMGCESKVSNITDQLGELGMAIDREIGWKLHMQNVDEIELPKVRINTQVFPCHYKTLSFEDICAVAGMPTTATVQYTRGNKDKPSGTVLQGESILVVDGLEIDCVPTGNA